MILDRESDFLTDTPLTPLAVLTSAFSILQVIYIYFDMICIKNNNLFEEITWIHLIKESHSLPIIGKLCIGGGLLSFFFIAFLS